MARLIIKSSTGLEVLVTQEMFNDILNAQAGLRGPITFKAIELQANKEGVCYAAETTTWQFVNYETMAQPIQVATTVTEPTLKPEELAIIKEITRIKLEPGETLIATVKGEVTEEDMTHLRNRLCQFLNTTKVMLLNGCDIDFRAVKVLPETKQTEDKQFN